MTSIKKIRVLDLNQETIEKMWCVFDKYYYGSNKETFMNDLFDKTYVFLLKDKESKKIIGFSTIKEFRLPDIKGRFLFSGDTIVEKEYWGKNSLGVEFARFLFNEKIKKPHIPLYWNLISKGYKTYLLLANNFENYYPNPYKETPVKYKEMIDGCGRYLFGRKYNSQKGVIEFAEEVGKDKLKEGICEIDMRLLCASRKINFFQYIFFHDLLRAYN